MQLLASVTSNVYNPPAAVVTFDIDGFCWPEVKLFGPLQLYTIVPVPPEVVAERLKELLVQTGELEVILVMVNGAGSAIVCDVVVVHPLATITVIVYAPSVRPVNIPDDAPVVFTVAPAIT